MNYINSSFYISLFCHFTVLLRTFCHLIHGRFLNIFRHSIGLFWTSDQPDAKASTYTGQQNTEIR
jgi:hypothetical protein